MLFSVCLVLSVLEFFKTNWIAVGHIRLKKRRHSTVAEATCWTCQSVPLCWMLVYWLPACLLHIHLHLRLTAWRTHFTNRICQSRVLLLFLLLFFFLLLLLLSVCATCSSAGADFYRRTAATLSPACQQCHPETKHCNIYACFWNIFPCYFFFLFFANWNFIALSFVETRTMASFNDNIINKITLLTNFRLHKKTIFCWKKPCLAHAAC